MKKMMIFFFAFLCGFAIFSLAGKIYLKNHATPKVHTITQVKKTVPKPTRVIQIMPIGYVKIEYINGIKSSIKKFYGYDCVILPEVAPTKDIMAPSNTRYEASKILEKYDTRDFRLIITEEDIACPNEERKVNEWGVFGLGYWPGTTCVVSTYRLKKTNGVLVSPSLVMERLNKIALHEIGHNLGLDHCTNDPRCMMCNANGTIKEVDQERMSFCDKCMSKISK
jgi:archaemetzincin